MEQRQKKILLLVLFILFFVLLTYQLRRMGERSEDIATLPISSEASPGGRISSPSLQGKSLLPEINLVHLRQPMPAYSVLGRNLFRFEVAKKVAPPSVGRQRQLSETQQMVTPRETEEGGVPIQPTTAEQGASPGSAQVLVELASFKFLGFARKDSLMIATLKRGDKVLVGVEGDIIEEKFTILEIDYQYVELGVVNTSFKQKIPLISESS